LAESVLTAAEILAGENLAIEVVDARFCKPVDGEMLARVLKPGHPVLTVEDHSVLNGFGAAVLEYANTHGLPTDQVTRLAVPDRLAEHAPAKGQLREAGLAPAGIAASVRQAIAQARQEPKPVPMPIANFV